MEYFVHECGSPSCIAGWAAWEFRERPEVMNGFFVQSDARVYLGINRASASLLFIPDHFIEAYEATPAQAAAVLRHLANTGKVEWERFIPRA